MLKNYFIRFSLFVVFVSVFTACEPYEDYIKDYDYSAVYFGSQRPLRTLVVRPEKAQLEFKLGVVLAGLRENRKDQWVIIEPAPDLLSTVDGASSLTLLPEDWYDYELSENRIIIPKGKFLGDFTITINKDMFTADPLSLNKTYALPFRIVSTSVDSVLRGSEVVAPKDYTIVVVKYINSFSGAYYVRGEQVELDDNGNEIESSRKKYFHIDWSQNAIRSFTTTSPTGCEIVGMGDQTTERMIVDFGSNNSVTLSSSNLPVTDLGCTYDQGVYRLNYQYVKGGKSFKVDEYLKQRNDPEKDLRFEEW